MLLSLSTDSSAQLYGGIKASFSIPFNEQQLNKYDDAEDNFIYSVRFIEQDYTPTISIVGYYRQDLVYFQTELGYRRARTKFLATDLIDLNDITITEYVKTTHILDIPLVAGIRLDRFKLGVGPIFSFILSENAIFENVEFFEERRGNLEAGFSFNVGVLLYRIHIDLSYRYQFRGVADYLYWRSAANGFHDPVQYLDLGMGFFF